MFCSDMPCNEMHTDRFIEEIREIGKVLGLKEPLVIQGEELNEKGIGGIYGVGKASVHKPGNGDSVICLGKCFNIEWGSA